MELALKDKKISDQLANQKYRSIMRGIRWWDPHWSALIPPGSDLTRLSS
ncbi:hypothetical protein [Microbulbifer hydrolyticus]|uniref:Integrase n=1 Tax=Microbulbifer hydrolyticus TaxID=48074 RepID=A0ABX6IZF9_9GAMM|nr:hypothetical protein [Microbulbifer hydrolyticus]QHQ40186.1 hypothetical protein GTQ55_15160 [Microbulbifer hydrolyticus]